MLKLLNSFRVGLLERVEPDSGGFPEFIRPLKRRINAALLGAFTVHDRIIDYGVKRNLREAIEEKINQMDGVKELIAVNSSQTYFCFSTTQFSYNQLLEIKKATYAADFLLVSVTQDALFVFYEDDPACFMSYRTEEDFASCFMSSAKANEIFKKNMMNWTISSLPSQAKWLEAVRSHIS